MKISYNWLKSYIPDVSEPNHLESIFTYHLCEVESVTAIESIEGEKDWIYDLGILPNRAHDLLSHQGVARELAGLLGLTFKDPTSMYKVPPSITTDLKVEINSPNCRRYSARIVRNIKIGPSPKWVVECLESIGQRSINNIVDATNIVMYDCGQPTHAFDLGKITNYELRITNAKEGEELKVVGREGILAKLKENDLTITSGDKILALGGVKGGLDSGISDVTTDIVLEVANFDPTSVRKTARRLGLLSDSAKRFENDLSSSLCDFAMLELSGLIAEICPEATFEDVVDIYPNKDSQKEVKVDFALENINKILGISITGEEVEDILKRYNFTYKKVDNNFTLEVPPMRLDLANTSDIAEEIGRIIGYDKVIPQLPKINFTPKENPVYENIKKARNYLIESGYREVMTYAFTESGEVEVLASASDKNFMRTNLSDGLKNAYELNKLNSQFLGHDEIKIFEIGTVFKNGEEFLNIAFVNKKEMKEMSLGEFIRDNASEELHSGSTNISLEGNFSARASSAQGSQNETPPTLPESTYGSALDISYFKMWSLYPFIVRDIAVWVPEDVESSVLSQVYTEFGTELLQGEPKLLDKFKKNGKISYAYRLIFQSYDRTLTTEEVNIIMSKITEKIASLGYEVR